MAVWQANHGLTISTNIYPLEAYAIRNNQYKLVINKYQSYDATANACAATQSTEFYEINENVPVPKLDTADADLLASGTKLNPEQQTNYDALSAELQTLLASQPACLGDINLDGVVNKLDIGQWAYFEELTGKSSWADLNQDGLTNDIDLNIIHKHLGACPQSYRLGQVSSRAEVVSVRWRNRPTARLHKTR